MKNFPFYKQDSGSGGAPPPPPPPQQFDPPPPPPPPGGGPPPPPGGTTPGDKAATNAIVSLVVGIVSLLFSCGCGILGLIGGIVAWMMGKKELAAIDQGTSSEAGRNMAKWGMWLGIIAVILSVLGMIISVIYYMVNGTYYWDF